MDTIMDAGDPLFSHLYKPAMSMNAGTKGTFVTLGWNCCFEVQHRFAPSDVTNIRPLMTNFNLKFDDNGTITNPTTDTEYAYATPTSQSPAYSGTLAEWDETHPSISRDTDLILNVNLQWILYYCTANNFKPTSEHATDILGVLSAQVTEANTCAAALKSAAQASSFSQVMSVFSTSWHNTIINPFANLSEFKDTDDTVARITACALDAAKKVTDIAACNKWAASKLNEMQGTPTDIKGLLTALKAATTSFETIHTSLVNSQPTLRAMFFAPEVGGLYLLHSPIHTPAFATFYAAQNTTSNSYGTNLQVLDPLFSSYCDSLVIGAGSDSFYADPTCNCFAPSSQKGLRQYMPNALFGGNYVEYPPIDPVVANALHQNAVCAAPACNYDFSGTLQVSEEFMVMPTTGFKDVNSSCNNTIEIAVCTNVFSAGGSINVDNSNIFTKCANDNPTYGNYKCQETSSGMACVPAQAGDVGATTALQCMKNCNLHSKFSCKSGKCEPGGTLSYVDCNKQCAPGNADTPSLKKASHLVLIIMISVGVIILVAILLGRGLRESRGVSTAHEGHPN